MDEVKDMVRQWLDMRDLQQNNEEAEFKAREDAEERNEQVRRDFAEMGRVYDPYN